MSNYKLLDFKIIGDERGALIALEENHNIHRDKNAHKNLRYLAIFVASSCTKNTIP